MTATTKAPPPTAAPPPPPQRGEDEGHTTILVAAITGAFGARGEIRLKSFTNEPAACLSYAPFVDVDGKVILKISKPRQVKGGFAVRSPGVQYRDQAEALRGTKLYCLREVLPAPEKDEFYHSDLLGLSVFSADDVLMGRIADVQNYGASDLLEICDTPNVTANWTLPFTLAHVPLVDVPGKKVSIQDWQEFLPDKNAKPKQGQ
ncbi:16S rRNA processing protein RimM [hydrothermal vent metagenome]|uniref:16S rRNA processing protein RimM n=1 Tax=hydrothermal vent metagenome TaxID=652676 RepID=A0A3B0RE40_9ZZZZ